MTLPPLQLREVPVAFGTNPITVAEKEIEAKLLPPSSDGESDSDVEVVDGPRGWGRGRRGSGRVVKYHSLGLPIEYLV